MSLTATKSMSESPSEARRTLRPMRPKPLMPTLIAIVKEASSRCLRVRQTGERGKFAPRGEPAGRFTRERLKPCRLLELGLKKARLRRARDPVKPTLPDAGAASNLGCG